MVDTIRAGTAPAIIKRKGAEGSLPVALEEKIEILIALVSDLDEELRSRAWQTLVNWEPAELQRLLADAATPWEVIDYLASYIAPGRPELIQALNQNPGIPPELIEWLKSGAAAVTAEPPPLPPPADNEAGAPRLTLIQRINAMTPAEKIKTALTGNQEERMILIRDANKLVARAVLRCPKVNDTDVVSYARMKNVTEEVLRTIAMSRGFMKTYAVARALINNPRSPLEISLPIVNRLTDRDLKGLSLNKNVPETLRATAAKLIRQRQEAQKVKIPTGKH